MLVFAGGVAASGRLAPGWDFSKFPPRPDSPPTKSDQAIHNIDTSVADPFIANGVSVGDDVELYYSSGIGPGALNTAAPGGTPSATSTRRTSRAACSRPASPSPRRRA